MINLYTRRRIVNAINLSLSVFMTAFGLFWLVWLLWTLFSNGFQWLGPDIFTKNTPPPGSAGGLANAIVGSLIITGVATLIGTPVGVLVGTYLAEYGRFSRDRAGDTLPQRYPAQRAIHYHRCLHL